MNAAQSPISLNLLSQSWKAWISNGQRQAPGPWWLQWLWTLLFSCGVAIFFTVLGFAFSFGGASGSDKGWGTGSLWLSWFGRNLVIALAIGVIIHVLFEITQRWFAPPQAVESWPYWQRTLYFSAVPMAGVLVGWPMGFSLLGGNLLQLWSTQSGKQLLGIGLFVALAFTYALHLYFSARARELEAQRRAAHAQLRLAQAQMEPHFLFNTLANVQSLIGFDAPRAAKTLAAFTEYLRASLGQLRQEEVSLADELALADAYLQVQQARMEDRLVFRLDVPTELKHALLPALLLQPLVENAVLHGLEPHVAGGQVQVTARVDGQHLVLQVLDDGLGLQHRASVGRPAGGPQHASVALANIHERLCTQFGSSASLLLTSPAPGQTASTQGAGPGTLATLRLPLRFRA